MNTYTLEKNGRTHMLLPIKDKEVKPEVRNTILLMSAFGHKIRARSAQAE
jgi:hypothetical protein